MYLYWINVARFVSCSLSDKDSKMRYLEKALDCVAIASGTTLTAKPGKIVSGQVSLGKT